MKLSEQVCTLEQAKRLKELGIEQKSICYHHFQKDYGFAGVQENKENHTVSFGKPPMITDMAYSAFTVAELGVMLPIRFESWLGEKMIDSKKVWVCYGRSESKLAMSGKYDGKILRGETEAEARAAMLIYLLETNLVTPAETNQRLTQK